jgi:hypothetical protein
VEARSPGCEVIYLAGAKSQESIGLLRRLNRAVAGYGLPGCLNPCSCSSSCLYGVSRVTARRTRRHDEWHLAPWKGKALETLKSMDVLA